MVRQIRPARVFDNVRQEMSQNIVGDIKVERPPWFNVMRAVPPSETLVRTITPRHKLGNPRAPKPKNLYRPQNLAYTEDRLRDAFFKDHPWELARPRIIMELDGKDYQMVDWSKGLKQRGIQLSGESVVQRQMWLMENEGMGRQKAYDVTRREFYRLRQEQEIEQRIAVEEARHVGAYFDLTKLDIGMLLENNEYERWKIWAGKETLLLESKENEEVDSFGEDDAAALGGAPVEGEPEPAAPSSSPAPGAPAGP